ncbi:hypothetical protein RIF29_15140 [Crotalaria pallida]|uniref:Transmembrane protein 19 n=1 Tax=Crotalaria pallida TaxID=3830 RepID=A0AAN9FEM7_CROPI
MDPILLSFLVLQRLLVAVFVSLLIAFRAHKRKSLSTYGVVAGFFVMALHIFVGFRFGAMLLTFFLTSSMLTKLREDKKQNINTEFKHGGQRNWLQVLANSAIASVLVVTIWVLTKGHDSCLNSKESALITVLIGGVIGHSLIQQNSLEYTHEVFGPDSMLSPVRKRTNGGVTKAGFLAAAAAGSLVGFSFVILELLTTTCGFDIALKQLLFIPIATLAGLCGSVIDSLLGATLQFTGFCSIRQKIVGKPGAQDQRLKRFQVSTFLTTMQ